MCHNRIRYQRRSVISFDVATATQHRDAFKKNWRDNMPVPAMTAATVCELLFSCKGEYICRLLAVHLFQLRDAHAFTAAQQWQGLHDRLAPRKREPPPRTRVGHVPFACRASSQVVQNRMPCRAVQNVAFHDYRITKVHCSSACLYDCHTGSIVPAITPKILIAAILGAIAAAAKSITFRNEPLSEWTSVAFAPFTALGVAISLFLGFRNNASYGRW